MILFCQHSIVALLKFLKRRREREVGVKDCLINYIESIKQFSASVQLNSTWYCYQSRIEIFRLVIIMEDHINRLEP